MVSQDDSVSWVIMAGKLRLMRLLIVADVRRPNRRRKSRGSKSRKARKHVWWRGDNLGNFEAIRIWHPGDGTEARLSYAPRECPNTDYPDRMAITQPLARNLGCRFRRCGLSHRLSRERFFAVDFLDVAFFAAAFFGDADFATALFTPFR